MDNGTRADTSKDDDNQSILYTPFLFLCAAPRLASNDGMLNDEPSRESGRQADIEAKLLINYLSGHLACYSPST
jgi:hypothetical protein